jgi:hypothetical protein
MWRRVGWYISTRVSKELVAASYALKLKAAGASEKLEHNLSNYKVSLNIVLSGL